MDSIQIEPSKMPVGLRGNQKSLMPWRTKPFGELGRWFSGGTPDTEEPSYWNGSIPWITASALTSPYLQTSERKLTPEGLKAGSRLVPPGTILFVVRGMSLKTEFRVGMATCEMAFGQDCKAVVPNPDVDSRFLLYALLARRNEILSLVDEASHGTGRLQTEAIQSVELGIPPLPEQRAIAHVLGTLDDKIELNRRMNATLEAMARALFKSWFVDFDPVRSKVEGRQPAGMNSETVALFPDVFDNDLPRGWRVGALGDIADVNWGDTNTTKSSYGSMGFPAYSAKGQDGFLPYFDYDRTGVVVSAIGAHSGTTWLALGKWSCIKNTIRFWEISEDISTEYLYLATYGKEKWPLRGSAQPFISQGDARKLSILIPGNHLGKVFGDLARPLFEQIKANDDQSRTLTAARDALLPKLMSGEIRVKDAEKFVEEKV